MNNIDWFHVVFYGVAALIILFGLGLTAFLIWGLLQTDEPKATR